MTPGLITSDGRHAQLAAQAERATELVAQLLNRLLAFGVH